MDRVTASFGQYSKVVVRVKWKDNSFDNKLEVYNPNGDLLLTLCDDAQCYTGIKLDSNEQYGARYDLGCVIDGNNYYIKLYDFANNGWESSSVKVKVAGVEVINDLGTGATSAGQNIYFNVSGGGAACSAEPDMDQMV